MRMYCPSCKKVTRWEVEEGYKSYYDNGESADNIKAFIRHRFCQGCDEAIRRGHLVPQHLRHEGPIQTIKTAELDCEFISELVSLRKERLELHKTISHLQHELFETIQRFKNAGTRFKEALDTFEGTVEFSEKSVRRRLIGFDLYYYWDLGPKDINSNKLRSKFTDGLGTESISRDKLREFEGDSISDESPLKTEVLEKIAGDPNVSNRAKMLATSVITYRQCDQEERAALEVLRKAGIPMPEEKDTETESQE